MNLEQALAKIAEQNRLINSKDLTIRELERRLADVGDNYNNAVEYIKIIEDKNARLKKQIDAMCLSVEVTA